MIKVSEFKSCRNNPPKKNGHYMVVRFNEDGALSYGSALEYLVGYGWNTCVLTDGTIYTDSEMTFDNSTVWAEVTEIHE